MGIAELAANIGVLAGFCLYYASEFDSKPQGFFALVDVVGVRALPPTPAAAAAANSGGGAATPGKGAGYAWSFEVALQGGKRYQFGCPTREARAEWFELFAGVALLNDGD